VGLWSVHDSTRACGAFTIRSVSGVMWGIQTSFIRLTLSGVASMVVALILNRKYQSCCRKVHFARLHDISEVCHLFVLSSVHMSIGGVMVTLMSPLVLWLPETSSVSL
jgi:hypothetical protein